MSRYIRVNGEGWTVRYKLGKEGYASGVYDGKKRERTGEELNRALSEYLAQNGGHSRGF